MTYAVILLTILEIGGCKRIPDDVRSHAIGQITTDCDRCSSIKVTSASKGEVDEDMTQQGVREIWIVRVEFMYQGVGQTAYAKSASLRIIRTRHNTLNTLSYEAPW